MNKSMKMILVLVLLCFSINSQINGQDNWNQVRRADEVLQVNLANQDNQINHHPPKTYCYDYTICGNYCWSQWYDIDNTGGNGDYETIKDIRKQYQLACPDTQVLVECQTTTGIPFYKTIDKVHFNQVDGCWCINLDNLQHGGCKHDYRIRILCPC